MAAYQANRRESEAVAIDNNTVAALLVRFIQDRPTWRGTASELITALVNKFPTEIGRGSNFPSSPNQFGTELRRITPLLRSQGITVAHTREGKGKSRIIDLSLA